MKCSINWDSILIMCWWFLKIMTTVGSPFAPWISILSISVYSLVLGSSLDILKLYLPLQILRQALQDVSVYRSEFYDRSSRKFLSTDQNFMTLTGPPGSFCPQTSILWQVLQDVSFYRDQNFTTSPPGCFCLQNHILEQALLNEMKNMPEWKGSWQSASQNVDWLIGDRFYPALVFRSWADSLHSKHWRPLSKSRSRREAEL